MKKIKYLNLIEFTKKILLKAGLDNFSANSVSHGLCEASLRGVDSHGVRLLLHYVNSAINGRKNPRPKFFFEKKFSSLGVLHADNAYGHSAGMKAIDLCMGMARKNGVGIVAVKNSSHSGAMASMALRASRKGFASFAFTHADSLMLSHNGKKPYFGTNPICFSCPRKNEEPYCLDMATTFISWNKLLSYKNKNKNLPKNYAADQHGKETSNPNIAESLLPIGTYKGYGLASMVEILCGIYTGMPFGNSILPMFTSSMNKKRNLGQFYIVFRIDGCVSRSEFENRMKIFSNQIRNQPSKSKKGVLMPNDIEIRNAKKRKKDGIPITNNTYKNLIKLSSSYNVNLKIK